MIPPEWLRLLSRLGIRLSWELGECFCELTASGYRINLDPRLPEDTHVVILRHELQHALAGDCVPGRAAELGLTPHQLNIVADAVINASLPLDALLRASHALDGPSAKPITLELFGWDKNYTPSRAELVPIARSLQADQSDQSDQPDRGQPNRQRPSQTDDQTDELRHDSSVSPDELRRVHREFIEKARGEIEALESSNRPPPASPRGAEARIRSLAAILAQRAYRSGGRVFTYTRSYKRPGRTPLTRGVCREPRVKIAALIDSSDSLREHWPALHALAQQLARAGELEVIAFAADAKFVRGPGLPSLDTSSTRIGPALQLARDAAALIIISDFELSDPGALKDIHSPWIAVVVGNSTGSLVPAGIPKVRIDL
jgi:hypothetical protein